MQKTNLLLANPSGDLRLLILEDHLENCKPEYLVFELFQFLMDPGKTGTSSLPCKHRKNGKISQDLPIAVRLGLILKCNFQDPGINIESETRQKYKTKNKEIKIILQIL